MSRDYRTLDAIVVVACLMMLAGGGWALVFITIPQANLPVFSALVSGSISGMLGLYTGARWGNKKPTSEDPAPGGVSLSLNAKSGPAVTSEEVKP